MTAPAAPAETTPQTTPVTTPPAAPEADGVETFSRDYVQELRNEAAKARTDKKTAVEQARAALSVEHTAALNERDTKLAETQSTLSVRELELLKLKVTLGLKVPSDKAIAFAAVLTGTDEETVKASAKEAVDLFGGLNTPDLPTDPSQGHGNGGTPMPLNGDPVLDALKRKVGVR